MVLPTITRNYSNYRYGNYRTYRTLVMHLVGKVITLKT